MSSFQVATYLNLWTWPNGGIYFAFNYIIILIVIGLLFQLQLKHLQLQPTMIRVAIDVYFELQIMNILSPITVLPLQFQPDSGSSCNQSTLQVANTECFLPDTILPLQSQPDSGSSCNWYTLGVANTKCCCLILYYPFSCNPRDVWDVIYIHSVLQILSGHTWYCTTTRLQPDSGSSCNRCTLWVTNIECLILQPDSGSSCNWYTPRVANTECFHLILYYPFSCNPTVVRVVINLHSELQILNASTWYCNTPSVAIGQWFELQSMYTPSCKYIVFLQVATTVSFVVATSVYL
jgi:hypothetical protein